MSSKFFECIGWYGMAAALLAYVLVSFGWIEGRSLIFQLLNFTASVGLALISLRKRTYQPAVLNILWGTIAFIAIVRLLI